MQSGFGRDSDSQNTKGHRAAQRLRGSLYGICADKKISNKKSGLRLLRGRERVGITKDREGRGGGAGFCRPDPAFENRRYPWEGFVDVGFRTVMDVDINPPK